MLRLELLSETDLEVVYNYLPEAGNKKGSITLNKKSGEIESVVIAENDLKERYMNHAVSAIIKYHAAGTFPKEDVVAWY